MNTDPARPESRPTSDEDLLALGSAVMKSGGSGKPAPWQPPSPEELQKMLPSGYEVAHMLGRGGMGAVYLARQLSLNRLVAVKILSLELDDEQMGFAQRFKNEAQAMAQLNHAGIVSVYDFGQTEGGLLYIVMEYIDGTDVSRMVARQGRLHSAHAMAITAHVCDALAYAHGKGIIHRDIKPSNIMVGRDGVVKVADFGLAKMSKGQTTGLTQSGMAMGTLHFMAPEALMLGTAVDQRADIYAVGVMLYQMLTGKLPQGLFEMPSLQVPGLDPRYDGIVAKALREDREKRYQDAAELRRDLDAILTQPVLKVEAQAQQAPAATPAAPPPGQVPPRTAGQPYRPPQRSYARPVKKKSATGMLLASLASLVLLVGGFFMFGSKVGISKPRQSTETFEGEDLKLTRVSGGKAEARPTTGRNGFWSALWSSDKQLEWTEASKGDTLALSLPVQEGGTQRVRVMLTQSPDSGIVEVRLDGKPVQGSPFDLWASGRTTTSLLDCGVHDLSFGEHELTLTFTDTHSVKGTFEAALDFIRLEPPDAAQDTSQPSAAGTNLALAARPSASACNGWTADHVSRLNDGAFPAGLKSTDPSARKFGTFPQNGGFEWVQYEWDSPQFIDECQVLWSTQTLRVNERDPVNQLPQFWRVVFEDENGAWVPVNASIPSPEANRWNTVRFPTVKTRRLRLVVQCANRWSFGIHEWQALAADAATYDAAIASARPAALFLGDLPPLSARVGWDRYRVNQLQLDALVGEVRVMLKGKPTEHFLRAHALSSLDFAIPDGFTRFTATAVDTFGHDLDPQKPGQKLSHNRGEWTAQVRVDDRVIFNSKEIHTYPAHECSIDVALPPGAKVLSLIAYSGASNIRDDSIWAEPLLHRDSTSASAQSVPESPTTAAESKQTALTATKEQPFVNSLGMKFVPVPGAKVMFCVHEARFKDYAAFATENPKTNSTWKTPAHQGTPVQMADDHPVVSVSWDDAQAFCDWLGRKEGRSYRLPRQREWSYAAGLGPLVAGLSSNELTRQAENFFPWGKAFPPPAGTGNFRDSSSQPLFPGLPLIPGYNDGFAAVAPVMTFRPNPLGLHDLAGNVAEWCQEDEGAAIHANKALRGGNWGDSQPHYLRSLTQTSYPQAGRLAIYGFRCVIEVPDASWASQPPWDISSDVSGTTAVPEPVVTPVAATASPVMDPLPNPEVSPHPQSAEASLAKLEAQYLTAFECDAGKEYKTAIQRLKDGYLAALARAQGEASAKRDLDAATAIRAEKARMAAPDGVMPGQDEAGTPPALAALRTTYRTTAAKLAATRDDKARPLLDRYLQTLAALQAEFTKAQRLDDALKVKDKVAQLDSPIPPMSRSGQRAMAGRVVIVPLSKSGVISPMAGGAFDFALSNTSFVDVAAFDHHVIAVTEAGKVVRWGADKDGQPFTEAVPDLSKRAIACSAAHLRDFIVYEDGDVRVLGRKDQVDIPKGLQIKKVFQHAWSPGIYALDFSDHLHFIGYSGDRPIYLVPAALQGVPVQEVSVSDHVVALAKSGQVVVWGKTSENQLPLPPELQPGSKITARAVATNGSLSFAALSNGNVITWGNGLKWWNAAARIESAADAAECWQWTDGYWSAVVFANPQGKARHYEIFAKNTERNEYLEELFKTHAPLKITATKDALILLSPVVK